MRSTTPSILLLLLGIFICTNATAEVYKHTNPDGSVTFSDVPTKIDAEPIKLPPSSTYSAPPLPRATVNPKAKKAEVDYESVAITSPANDTVVRDNAGNITINISVKPALKPGHTTVLIMDGKNVGEGQGGNIQVTNIDRGSHTFTVRIVDNQKKTVLQSDPVTVHLQRVSTINRGTNRGGK
jgi:hypothetical protein